MPFTIAAGGALLGAIGGAAGSSSSQTTRLNLAPESEQESQARDVATGTLTDIQGLVQAGPGQAAVGQAAGATEDFAERLRRVSQQGLQPSQIDIQAAQAQLAPQRVALDQSFQDEQVRAQRLAAQLNRPVNDPIIQAKLAQERIRSEERFGADVSRQAQGANLQRLNFSQALSGLRQGLATQALTNRQTLLGLGSGIQNQLQNFRLGSAGQTTTGSSGGGIGGAITGALGGAGAGLNLAGSLGGIFGGGGAAPSPFAAAQQGTAGSGLLKGFGSVA